MAFSPQEQEILRYGVANGKSKDEIMNALMMLRTGVQPKPTPPPASTPQQPGLLDRVKNDIQDAGSNVADAISGTGNYQDQSPLRRGAEATAAAFNTIPKVASELLPQPARDVLGKVGEVASKGINWLADKYSNNPAMQELVMKYPNVAHGIEDVAGTAAALGQTAGDILLADGGVKVAQKSVDLTKKGVGTAIDTTAQAASTVADSARTAIGGTGDASPQIMNRVARLKPTDFTKFQKMAGKTPGDYLTETGNFGTPDKIIANEATKFANSVKSVDEALSQLPGTYTNGAIEDALNGLIEKAKSVSSENVKAPYLKTASDLMEKYQNGGLSMEDINTVKRLYERSVKLGYNKLVNPDKVELSTNIDSALREWQVKQASDLGFKNIAEMNKQTQISKFLINKLGDQVVGQSGLNSVTLTDWIMLSGGDPTAVGGFLTKKFFSSKAVQAKIAEMLNGKEIKGPVTPDMKPMPTTATPATQPVQETPVQTSSKSTINRQKGAINYGAIVEQAKNFLEKRQPSKALLDDMAAFLNYTRLGKVPDGYKDGPSFDVNFRDALAREGINSDVDTATLNRLVETILRVADYHK